MPMLQNIVTNPLDYFEDVFINFLDKDSTVHTFPKEGQKDSI